MDYPHNLYCENVKKMAVVALYLRKDKRLKLAAALERAFSGSNMPSGLRDQAIIAARNRINLMRQEATKSPKQLVLIPRRRAAHAG